MNCMKGRFVINSNILVYMLNRDAGEEHREALKFVRNARKKDTGIPIQCLAETYSQVIKKI